MTIIREISLNSNTTNKFQKNQFQTSEIGNIPMIKNNLTQNNAPASNSKLIATNKEQVIAKTSLSKEFIETLMDFEGLKLKAYSDSGDVKTIGWGHNIEHDPNYPYGKKDITPEQAYDLLAKDLLKAQDDLKNAIGDVKLTKNQYEAMVDMFFNVGKEKLENTNLMAAIKEKRFDDAICEFNFICQKDKTKAEPALCRRRIDDLDRFCDGRYSSRSVESMEYMQNRGLTAFDEKIKSANEEKKDYYIHQKKVFLNITNPVLKNAKERADELAAREVFDNTPIKPIEKLIPNPFQPSLN